MGILFRVNVAQLLQNGLFDTASGGPIVVRGDSANTAGVLTWSSNNVVLTKEPVSVGSGSFWSGVAYFPKNRISKGTPISYKFFILNSSFGGWESGISNRTFNFPGNDTTLAWKFFNDKNPLTGIKDNSQIFPDKFQLYRNFPNPFNPGTTIKYSVPKRTQVQVSIFNSLGELIKSLVNESEDAGTYSINWNGTNESGRPVGSGVYLIRLNTEWGSLVSKMILSK